MFTYVAASLVPLAIVMGIAYKARKLKQRGNDQPLIASVGIVEEQLSPVGAVLVNGELWSARSKTGHTIASQTQIVVVAIEGFTLVVSTIC